MEVITKIVKYLEDSLLIIKGVSERIQNKVKKQKRRIFSLLIGTLSARLFGNILAGKGVDRAGYGSKDLQSKGG